MNCSLWQKNLFFIFSVSMLKSIIYKGREAFDFLQISHIVVFWYLITSDMSRHFQQILATFQWVAIMCSPCSTFKMVVHQFSPSHFYFTIISWYEVKLLGVLFVRLKTNLSVTYCSYRKNCRETVLWAKLENQVHVIRIVARTSFYYFLILVWCYYRHTISILIVWGSQTEE